MENGIKYESVYMPVYSSRTLILTNGVFVSGGPDQPGVSIPAQLRYIWRTSAI